MKNITEYMLRYREASRTLWNLFFLPTYLDSQVDTGFDFLDAEKILFLGLVLRPLGLYGSSSLDAPILVSPTSSNVSAMISNPRENDKCHYWDHEIDQIQKDDIELAFIEFFDFRALDSIIDYQYAKCRILNCTSTPNLKNHEVLVEVKDVDFLERL